MSNIYAAQNTVIQWQDHCTRAIITVTRPSLLCWYDSNSNIRANPACKTTIVNRICMERHCNSQEDSPDSKWRKETGKSLLVIPNSWWRSHVSHAQHTRAFRKNQTNYPKLITATSSATSSFHHLHARSIFNAVPQFFHEFQILFGVRNYDERVNQKSLHFHYTKSTMGMALLSLILYFIKKRGGEPVSYDCCREILLRSS